MRGYHPTAIPDRDADQETLAHDALALIEALGASEAIVIGHDWGAAAAYGAAALGPDRVTKLFAARHSASGYAQAVAEKALGCPPFRGIQATWGAEPLCAQRLCGACPRSADDGRRTGAPTSGIRRGAGELFEPREFECGVRLLPEAFADTQRIAEGADYRAHGRVCRAR